MMYCTNKSKFFHISFHVRQVCICTNARNHPEILPVSPYEISSANICRNGILVPATEFERFGNQTSTFNGREWRTNCGTPSSLELERASSELQAAQLNCNCFDVVLDGRSLKSMDSDEFVALMKRMAHEEDCACARKARDEFGMWASLRKARKESHKPPTAHRAGAPAANDPNAFAFNLPEAAQARYWFSKYLQEDDAAAGCRSSTAGQNPPTRCRICNKSLKKKKNKC